MERKIIVKIAKRKLFVTKKQLQEIFGLPEDIEVMDVNSSNNWNDEQSFEFLLVSAGEVEVNGHKITTEVKDGIGLQRRLGLETLDKIMNGEEMHTGGYIDDWWWEKGSSLGLKNIYTEPMSVEIINNTNMSVDKNSNPDKVAKEIFKKMTKANKKGDNDMKFKNVVKDNMSFGDAVNALHEGRKVSRSIWEGYWVIEDREEFGEVIVAYLKDGGKAVAQPYNQDMLALDWRVVE
jgi:hypothetical protein